MKSIVKIFKRWFPTDSCVMAAMVLFLASFLQHPADSSTFHEACATISSLLLFSYYVSSTTQNILCHWRIFPFVSSILLHLLVEYSVTDRNFYFYTTIFCALLVLFNIPLMVYLPISSEATLYGTYPFVGTTSFCCKYNGEALSVQAWFPLQTALHDQRAMLWTSGYQTEQEDELLALLKQVAALNHIPEFLLRHLALTRTNAQFWPELIVPSLTVKYPVVIYSHGLYGWRQVHHSACERLASDGFIVFSLDHTPDSSLTRPFGVLDKAVKFDFLVPEGTRIEDDRKFHISGAERRHKQIYNLVDYLRNEYPMKASLDFEKLCIFGHSYGGCSAASVACHERKLIKACAVLDGWMFPLPDATRNMGCSVPLLMMSSHRWATGKYQHPYRADFEKKSINCSSSGIVIDAILKGSNHQNFCDSHYLCHQSILKGGSFLGEENAKFLIESIDGCLVGFFRHCIDNVDSESKVNSETYSLEYFYAKYLLSQEILRKRSLTAKQIRVKLDRFKNIVSSAKSMKTDCSDSTYFLKMS